jgi:PAS domain S-box-containing protein
VAADPRSSEAEVLYRALVEQSLVGVYLTSGDRFRYVNQALADLYGYTREEMVGPLHPLDTVYPEDRALVEANIRARLEGRIDALRYTYRAIRKDGGIVYCEVFGKVTEWNGHPAVVGTLVDITERKRAEEAARESLETLQAVIAASPVPIYILDAGGLVKLWNPAAERTFGWSAAETLGQLLPIVPPNKTEEFRAYLARAISGDSLLGVELERRRKNGSPIDIALSTAPLFDSSGVIRGTVSLAMDITLRRQAEEVARESRDTLQAVIQSAPIAVYAIDLAGRVMMWNPGAAHIFGWGEAEVLGQPLPTVPEDRRAEFQTLLEAGRRSPEERRGSTAAQGERACRPAPLYRPTSRRRGPAPWHRAPRDRHHRAEAT